MAPADVDELFPVLDDPSLHTFIGDAPKTRDELEEWIRFVARGRSPDGDERWCNWVVRRRADRRVIGTAQATIVDGEATLAWVIGSAFQGQGFAKEAATAVAGWTQAQGVARLRAAIHPEHAASGAVASSIGLEPTEERDDGEVVWRSP
jgi:RimJ/RimL family protein N-acetyltransferase